jgi:hypothetical protein
MSASRDGLQAWCKECSKASRKPKAKPTPKLVKDVAPEDQKKLTQAAKDTASQKASLQLTELETLAGERLVEIERLKARIEELSAERLAEIRRLTEAHGEALAEQRAKIDELRASGESLSDESEGRLREIRKLREQLLKDQNERDEAVTVADLQHDALLTLSVYTCALQGLVTRTGNPKWIEFANGAETVIQGVLPLWKTEEE